MQMGQWEPGNTMDLPLGMRKMHTCTKEPVMAPKIKRQPITIYW